MKTLSRLLTFIALLIPAARAQYTFIPLGTPPGGTLSGYSTVAPATVYNVNSKGELCGSLPSASGSEAAMWKPTTPNGPVGSWMLLGAPILTDGPSWSVCTAISTYAAAGYGYTMAGVVRALVFGGEAYPVSATVPAELPLPETPDTFVAASWANVVSETGVVGGAWTSPDGIHAMIWKLAEEGTHYDLNDADYPGWVLNAVTGISKFGMVGYGTFMGGPTHGFLISAAGITDLGSLAGPSGFSVATSINDKGQVVGYSMIAGFHHAFLWDKGTMTDLGVPPAPFAAPAAVTAVGAVKLPSASMPSPFKNSFATHINNNGKITGWANAAPFGSMMYGVAVLYDANAGAAPPLKTGWNHLSFPPVTMGVPPGALLVAALSINDNDQVMGQFDTMGSKVGKAFLLNTPLPVKP